MRKQLRRRALRLTLFTLVVTLPAFAYLDPGTGSFACQLLLGAALGILFVARANLDRIKAWLQAWFSKDLRG